MRIFLIDFENVHSEGLAGVDFLSENDEVVIFHSNNADTITFEMMHKLMCSKAKLSYYKVRRGGRNALDFQMSSYLGYLVNTHGVAAKAEFFLISKDNGFDFVIDFWESGNINIKPKIKRFYTIKAVFGQAKSSASAKTAPAPVQETADEQEAPVIIEVAEAVTASELPVIEEPPLPEEPSFPESPPLPDKPTIKKRPAPRKKPVKKEEPPVEEEVVAVAEAPVEEEAAAVDENEAVIARLLSEAKSSHELYISSVKRFGQKKGVEIYREIKSRFNTK
jgi:hypothetical protein